MPASPRTVAPAQHDQDVADRPPDRLGVDPVFGVVLLLELAPAVGLGNGAPHRVGHLVGVHDDRTVDVTGGPPDRLDKRCLRTQEALFVGVQDRHERNLRQVDAFPEQVYAHKHVELAEAEVPQDLDPLERLYVRVQVAHLQPLLEQVVRQVLGHLLGQEW